MNSSASEGFHSSSCFKVIGIFKVTGQTAGWRPAQLVERRGTAITTKLPVFLHPLLQMLKACCSPQFLQPGRTRPGWQRSFLNRGRPVASESIKGNLIAVAVVALHFCSVSHNILDLLSLKRDCCGKETHK